MGGKSVYSLVVFLRENAKIECDVLSHPFLWARPKDALSEI